MSPPASSTPPGASVPGKPVRHHVNSALEPADKAPPGSGTCVHPVVGLQLVLQAELLPAAVTFVRLLPGVDALVALQRVLVPEAAPAELALIRVVACCGGVGEGEGGKRESQSRVCCWAPPPPTLSWFNPKNLLIV